MPDTLTIEIPRPEAVEELNKIRREASERAYVEGVFDLIRRGVISTGYGRQLLGISIDALLDELQRHEIPMADYSEDELRSELEAALSDFDGKNRLATDAGRLQHNADQRAFQDWPAGSVTPHVRTPSDSRGCGARTETRANLARIGGSRR